MVIAAGLLLEFCLVIAGFCAWCRITVKTRLLFWLMLLEKYPPRPDICVALFLDALDAFVIANLVVGGQNMGIADCPILIGERGIHLANGAKAHCRVGGTINAMYIFIPWSRLHVGAVPSCLEVLGTGDHLLLRTPVGELMALRPGLHKVGRGRS